VARTGRTAEGAGARATKALRFSQGLAPLARKTLPRLPGRPTQFLMGEVFARRPGLWGLTSSSVRVQASRRAFERSFPDQDVERLLSAWVMARGRGMAACVNYLARWTTGRPSRLIRLAPAFELPDGPCVFASLHYSIDPLVQLACMALAPGRNFRWASYPMQPGVEDDRELWLANAEMPPEITTTLLSITDPRWVAQGIDHLREGGTLFMAIDAPFDGNRPAMTTIPAGRSRLPLTPSVELFAEVEDVRLVLAWPSPRSRTSWTLDVRRAASVEELGGLAGEWIESHREHWAGWPYLVWRENATAMRENVKSLRARADGG